MVYKYAHPEWFEGIEEPDLQAYNGNIIIHGTEAMGALAAHALKKRHIDFICYTDNDIRKQGTKYFEHDVISPVQAFEKYPDALVFIASSTIKVIRKELAEVGFKKLNICFCLFKEVDLDGFEHHRTNEQIVRCANWYLGTCLIEMGHFPDNTILNLSVYTTTRCTLRCKNCSQFIPYIKDPKDYDSDKLIKIVDKITGLGFYIISLLITTGEPFLYKDLHILLSSFSKNDNIEKIYVITNATLMPDENLINELSLNPKIVVRMSNYGKLSNKLSELIELFEKRGVKYELTNYQFWKLEEKMQNFDLAPKELKEKYDNRICLKYSGVVAKEKLFLCPGAASAELTLDFEQDEDAVVDFKDTNLSDSQIYEKIIGMLIRDEPTTACQYCVARSFGENIIKVPVAEQIE